MIKLIKMILKRFPVPLLLSFVFFTSSLVLLPSSFVYSAVPHLINYQGRLTDTSGSPLNGLYNITFRIYDAENSGNLLWQGTYTSITITKGIFNILLGDGSDTGFDFSTLAFDKPYWLEIKVGTDDPMTPRQRITSAAYAIRAERLIDEPLQAARGGTGTTATANVANGVVVLDANNKLPAADGSQLTGLTGFGAWVSESAVSGTIYQATTDGFVVAYNTNFNVPGSNPIDIYTDSSSNPTTLRARQTIGIANNWGGTGTVTCPVRKKDYWKVVCSNTYVVNWISLGK